MHHRAPKGALNWKEKKVALRAWRSALRAALGYLTALTITLPVTVSGSPCTLAERVT